MVFEETDVELCIETCELTNFSSAAPLHEITSHDYGQNNLKGIPLSDYAIKEENKTPLPISNPYIAAYLIVIGE